jgi:predicted DNA-binding helix-hairpin-helix protein
MLYLTKHEKAVLVVLAVVVVGGSLLNVVFLKAPGLTQWIDDRERFLRRTDVNAASLDELVRVPYIGEKSATRIIERRQKFGRITSLQELGLITRLSPENLEKAGKYLKI